MKIAFDVFLMQPGCPILQAALGAEAGIAGEFRPEDWLTLPTEGLHLYEISAEQLVILKRKLERKHNVPNIPQHGPISRGGAQREPGNVLGVAFPAAAHEQPREVYNHREAEPADAIGAIGATDW